MEIAVDFAPIMAAGIGLGWSMTCRSADRVHGGGERPAADTQGQPPKKKVYGDAESITACPMAISWWREMHRLCLYKAGGECPSRPAVVAGTPPAL
jgi:hypothetical protein